MIDVEKWWNEVNNNGCISGCISGDKWEDLDGDMKDEVLKLYLAAINLEGGS